MTDRAFIGYSWWGRSSGRGGPRFSSDRPTTSGGPVGRAGVRRTRATRRSGAFVEPGPRRRPRRGRPAARAAALRRSPPVTAGRTLVVAAPTRRRLDGRQTGGEALGRCHHRVAGHPRRVHRRAAVPAACTNAPSANPLVVHGPMTAEPVHQEQPPEHRESNANDLRRCRRTAGRSSAELTHPPNRAFLRVERPRNNARLGARTPDRTRRSDTSARKNSEVDGIRRRRW